MFNCSLNVPNDFLFFIILISLSSFLVVNALQVEVTPWISSKHNMGFAFNRSTWRSIVRCANHFCTYDDYNWDWSLQHVSQQCLRNKLHAMVVKGPRVFHIGEWFVYSYLLFQMGIQLSIAIFSTNTFIIFISVFQRGPS